VAKQKSGLIKKVIENKATVRGGSKLVSKNVEAALDTVDR
jgi:hypothetical protein